ncbi:hypothetical protein LTR42_006617 [Elasticomyces elasticus]|nr:hypothetical protein LTR42_006617 [Elasticomyces elasticus]
MGSNSTGRFQDEEASESGQTTVLQTQVISRAAAQNDAFDHQPRSEHSSNEVFDEIDQEVEDSDAQTFEPFIKGAKRTAQSRGHTRATAQLAPETVAESLPVKPHPQQQHRKVASKSKSNTLQLPQDRKGGRVRYPPRIPDGGHNIAARGSFADVSQEEVQSEVSRKDVDDGHGSGPTRRRRWSAELDQPSNGVVAGARSQFVPRTRTARSRPYADDQCESDGVPDSPVSTPSHDNQHAMTDDSGGSAYASDLSLPGIMGEEVETQFKQNSVAPRSSMSALRAEIESLKLENARLIRKQGDDTEERSDPPEAEWPTLHRISCSGSPAIRTYTDEPVLLVDRDENHCHLDSRMRIADEVAWMERHSHLPFVVYKHYECYDMPHSERTPQSTADPTRFLEHDPMANRDQAITEPVREDVMILSESLCVVVDEMLNLTEPLRIYQRTAVFSNNLLQAPYIFYYHCKDILAEYAASLPILPAGELQLLLNYFEQHVSAAREEVERTLGHGLVKAYMVPYLFGPGELLIVVTKGSETVVALQSDSMQGIVRQTERRSTRAGHYAVNWTCYIGELAFDGHFHRITTKTRFEMPRDEDRPIVGLPVYPLKYASLELREELLHRGRTSYSCTLSQYVTYDSDKDGMAQGMAEMRYMIDVQAFHLMHPDEARPRGTLLSESEMSPEDDDFLLQMPLQTQGFRMFDKTWQTLLVKNIRPVRWNKAAFDSLAIGDDHKLLTEALVRNKIDRDQGIDFIEGKGTGLIVLLHGVAEIAEKPLYRVTCGDVGTDAVEVEKYLESVFNLGRRWKSVVLMDEADVFLEQRTIDNMQRNALVSTFLRLIEFYDGILILTTNRVGIFDEAFKSRIQLALRYDSLNDGQRRRIWTNFLERLSSVEEVMDLSQIRGKLDELAQVPINGREIRNTINTARQLARFQKVPLNYGHVQKVLSVSREFERYIRDVNHGVDDDEQKRELGER